MEKTKIYRYALLISILILITTIVLYYILFFIFLVFISVADAFLLLGIIILVITRQNREHK